MSTRSPAAAAPTGAPVCGRAGTAGVLFSMCLALAEDQQAEDQEAVAYA